MHGNNDNYNCLFQEGYSSVRYWPAVVERMASDAAGGEWEVEFVEDEVSY